METKIPKSIIVGIQSVMPVEMTQTRQVRSISVRDPVQAGIFRRTLNIVTYYNVTGDSCERGWLVAGWIRESLGRVMTEYPMISGRLRRRKDGLEVVANDAGARLVEAKFQGSLQEFLEMVKRDKRRAQVETVFWRDIDEVDPQFSPLFYVQVSNFESGGYSIGIRCSILIADVLLETDFLKRWGQIQSSLAQTTLKPIFHLPSLRRNLGDIHLEFSKSASDLDGVEPVIFKAKACRKMSLACMKNTVVKLEKARADFFVFVKEQGSGCDEGMKVEIRSRDEVISDCDSCDMEETDVGGVNVSLAFGEGVECTSCWIGSVSKGVVMVMLVVPSTFVDAKSLATFIVALPNGWTIE